MQITTESKTTLLQGGTIITANAAGDIFPDAALLVKDGRIANILKGTVDPRSIDAAEVINASGFVIAPGFIQTHVHLCQTLFRGLADDLELLDWLQKKIFPLEAAHNNRSMYCSAMLGIAELVRCGTTTILDMGSVHEEEEVIRAIGETGYRAFVGKAMMDINGVFPKLKEPTGVSLRTTRELAERWHDSYNGRIKYAAAPRFVLSCTDALMREAYGMMGDFKGALFHTHASENRREIQAVRERCKMGNVEFLHHLGVLSNRSCLAHCIYVSEDEIGMLRSTNTNVSHCPS